MILSYWIEDGETEMELTQNLEIRENGDLEEEDIPNSVQRPLAHTSG